MSTGWVVSVVVGGGFLMNVNQAGDDFDWYWTPLLEPQHHMLEYVLTYCGGNDVADALCFVLCRRTRTATSNRNRCWVRNEMAAEDQHRQLTMSAFIQTPMHTHLRRTVTVSNEAVAAVSRGSLRAAG